MFSDLGSCDQEGEQFSIACKSGQVQGRESISICEHNVGTKLDQHLDSRKVAMGAGEMEWRLAIAVVVVQLNTLIVFTEK